MDLSCVLCGKYAPHVAAEEGMAQTALGQVLVTKGDPLCLDHGVQDKHGHPLLFELVVRIEPGKYLVGDRVRE